MLYRGGLYTHTHKCREGEKANHGTSFSVGQMMSEAYIRATMLRFYLNKNKKGGFFLRGGRQ